MRVLVTGALGFVGTAVVGRLVAAGHDVVALTHGDPSARRPRTAAAEIVHGDVLKPDDMARVVAEVDAVCHLAAVTRVRESFEQPDFYNAVNADGTRNVLEAVLGAARRRGEPMRFVHASTGAVYGAAEHQPIAEDAEPAPTSPYGESKLAADRHLLSCPDEMLGVVILRAFNIAGAVAGRADDDLTRIIPKAIAVARGEADVLQVNGDGTAVRDFVHVEDLARAYVAALLAATPGRREVLNVGATPASVAQIIAEVQRVAGRTLRVEHLPPKPEPASLLADTRRIRQVLDWSPQRSDLSEIITDAWSAASS
jgi:UDP-glucose 4-epimerase